MCITVGSPPGVNGGDALGGGFRTITSSKFEDDSEEEELPSAEAARFLSLFKEEAAEERPRAIRLTSALFTAESSEATASSSSDDMVKEGS